MELQGEKTIPASVATTWAALNDPSVLKACIAGCETVERTGDDAFVAVVAVKVGPVSARFKGNLQMTNVQAPHSYTINFDGQGGVAGHGKGSADVALTALADSPADGHEQTTLRYVARAQVGGKLAQIGSRLVDAAAAKIAEDFFKAFEAHLLAGHAQPVAVELAAAVPEAMAAGLATDATAAGMSADATAAGLAPAAVSLPAAPTLASDVEPAPPLAAVDDSSSDASGVGHPLVSSTSATRASSATATAATAATGGSQTSTSFAAAGTSPASSASVTPAAAGGGGSVWWWAVGIAVVVAVIYLLRR